MTPVQSRPRAWIRLPSGGRLDLINPSPDAWLNSDLAIRLSRTARWGGESKFDLPLSVAQHSLTVLALRRQWSLLPLTPVQELMELLHDAEEGFLMFDCISPLKAMLGQPFKDVGDRLMSAICVRYSLPDWSEEERMVHKVADMVAAASEAVHCAGWSVEETRNVLGITHAVLDADPLASVYGCAHWEPWEPQVAADRFLQELESLLAAAQEEIRQSA